MKNIKSPYSNKIENNNDSFKMNRRDFVKKIGLGIGMMALSSCTNTPVKKSVAYLTKSDNVISGTANYYATVLNHGYSVLVKTIDGRPIKVEGNKKCPISQGGVDAIEHASLLDLYSKERIKYPSLRGNRISWEFLDNLILERLNESKKNNKKIIFMSSHIYNPSTINIIKKFTDKYPNIEHIEYEPISYEGLLKANKIMFNKKIIPDYRFDISDLIVSINADFLGTWVSPTEFARKYIKNRNIDSIDNNKMSKHFQIESILSLSGSKADYRIPIKNSEVNIFVLYLYEKIMSILYGHKINHANNFVLSNTMKLQIDEISELLVNNQKKSILICGMNNVDTQIIINKINWHLNNYNNTIDFNNGYNISHSDDTKMSNLLDDMYNSKIDTMFFYNVNPCYNYYKKDLFTNLLINNIKLSVSFASSINETSDNCNVIAPDHNIFESWHDILFKKNVYSIAQPTINPLFSTRQMESSILKWTDNNINFYEYIKQYYKYNIYPNIKNANNNPDLEWNKILKNGFVELSNVQEELKIIYNNFNIKESINRLEKIIKNDINNNIGLELFLYEKIAIRDGKYTNNPLLQEMPDPISKVTWDNYISISPITAKKYNIKQEDVIELSIDKYSIELPILLQPGQVNNLLGVSLGYGRTNCGKIGNNIGANVFVFKRMINSTLQNYNFVKWKKTKKKYFLARTQINDGSENRDIIQELSFKNRKNNNKYYDKNHHYSLWSSNLNESNYQWGMVIDLNSCIGCSACIVSCNIENNIPIVGKNEVKKKREMHWLRIDRYYTIDSSNEENTYVVHQPMMCQHCNNAPCETVCPVLATVHSPEGLNQQVYNRCVGTRYCANNCPYKVRRFNWFSYYDNKEFDYNMNDNLGKLILNPDVTVRSRGVMEKCSMCIQRIQSGKFKAKIKGEILKDGDIETACSSSCPTNAITFGNQKDTKSRISKLVNNNLNYKILDKELNTRPNVSYITLIRNK